MKKESKKRSKPYHHPDLRRLLLTKGADLVFEEGTRNFSLREVARVADVSHAAPYRHFKDKEDLLAAIAEACFDEFGKYLHDRFAAAPKLDPLARLELLARGYLEFNIENPQRAELMFGNTIEDFSKFPQLQQKAHGVLKTLEELLAALGVPDPSPRKGRIHSLAFAFWSLIHGLLQLYLAKRLKFQGVTADEVKQWSQTWVREWVTARRPI